jgi:3-oxoadipate enol-lactonase
LARISVDPGFTLQCDIDDYLWPWEAAEPVLMVHGFARNSSFWRGWIPIIAAKHRVYRPELRGFGRSDVPPEGYRFDASGIVGDLLKVMDQCGLEHAHVVGESSGGFFSVAFALAHPERVSSLVLCDTPIVATESINSIYSLGQTTGPAAILEYGLAEWCRRTLKYRLDVEKASPNLQDWYVQEMGKTPDHIAAALNDLVRTSPSLAPLLKQVQVPVLLLSGDKSEISGDHQAVFAQEMPRAKVHNFQGYGHGVNVLVPEACAEACLQFWDAI